MSDYRVSCCVEGCWATINLSPKDHEQLQRTGERFYCPAGHRQHFTGKTDEQKEIDQLKRRLVWVEDEADYFNRECLRAEGQRDTAIELIRRCPVCAATPGRHVRIYRDSDRYEDDLANVRDWMAEHIKAAHMEPVREASDA